MSSGSHNKTKEFNVKIDSISIGITELLLYNNLVIYFSFRHLNIFMIESIQRKITINLKFEIHF
jgi:hypothetical protein